MASTGSSEKDTAGKASAGRRRRNGGSVEAMKTLRSETVAVADIEGNMRRMKDRARKSRASSEAPQDPKAKRMEMAGKLRAMLVNTPDDGRGTVPETPFTVAGVERAMKMISKRSDNTDSGGGKLAAGILRFFAPEQPSEPTVSGASIEKLQLFAKRTETVGR